MLSSPFCRDEIREIGRKPSEAVKVLCKLLIIKTLLRWMESPSEPFSGPNSHEFLRHQRSIVRWVDGRGQGAKQAAASSPPSHRLDESQLVIPRRVALTQSPPPLHQPVLSSRQPTGTVNLIPKRVGEFSTGETGKFQTALTDWLASQKIADVPAK